MTIKLYINSFEIDGKNIRFSAEKTITKLIPFQRKNPIENYDNNGLNILEKKIRYYEGFSEPIILYFVNDFHVDFVIKLKGFFLRECTPNFDKCWYKNVTDIYYEFSGVFIGKTITIS